MVTDKGDRARAGQDFTDLTVGPVPTEAAKKMMIENHYAHKWNTGFGVENIGVFRGGILLGAASFGHAMNPGAWGSVADIDPARCLELNRLWIDDELGRNTETWLMSRSWGALREKGYQLVQSFADGRLGVGTIYQAANFSYHGYHETLFHRGRDGVVWHDTPFSNAARALAMLKRNLLHARGHIAETFTVRTYRYLYPLSKYARRKIKLPHMPYPKERAGERVVNGYTAPPLQVARSIHIADIWLRDGDAADLYGYLNRTTDGQADRYLAEAADNEWISQLRESVADALF